MGDETPGRLAGLTIAVTREESGELARLLADAGARVLHFPLIRVVAADPAWQAEAGNRHYDWLVFTSMSAVRFAGRKVQADRVACVGEATAAAAKEAGYAVDLLPERQHAKGLIEAFAAQPVRGGNVLYPRSELAASTLKEGLQALGYSVDDPVAYRTLPDDEGIAALASQYGLAAIVLASPSAVRSAVTALGSRLSAIRIYTIGPSTSHAVRMAGLEVAGEAEEHSTAGLFDAILEGETNP